MALDFIVLNNDSIQITIDPPTVCPTLLAPIPLSASGFSVANTMAVCLEGDELPLSLRAPIPYTAPPYAIPGTATLSLTLSPTNKTQTAKDGDKVLLLKGQPFQAKLTVMTPAQMPTPAGPQPDPLATKTGTAMFITSNTVVQAE